MTIAVDVSDFVRVSVNISPLAVPYSNFGLPLVLGDSAVVDTVERYRPYANITAVGVDFGTVAPEYLAAQTFFSQTPQPNSILIGRWARTATAGKLKAATLTAAQQLLSVFTAIINGSFKVTIDGVMHDTTAINLSGALNLNGVAALIQTALRASFAGALITVVWNPAYSRFEITSATTGAASSVSYLSQVSVLGGSVDISPLLGGTLALGASPLVVGIVSETPLQAAQAAANVSNQWYGLSFAASVQPLDADYLLLAAYILASSRSRILALTIQNVACLDPTQSADLASNLQALANKRIVWNYSSTNPYSIMSLIGRAFTVNWGGNNTAITLAYKQMPGNIAEQLNETQFATVVAKGGNVDILVNNGAQMIWPSQMANGYWFDEVHGVDWLQNRVQTDLFNLLYQSMTKVPQTDAGSTTMCTVIEASCVAGINNGLGAPGVWNVGGFGSLFQGDTLTKGFYVYAPLVATQSAADRTARVGVPIQVAFKLAGAVHQPNVMLNINR